jgi:hypothetical protein
LAFDPLSAIGTVQAGPLTLEYGNVGESNCVYFLLKGEDEVVPCLIYDPEELNNLLAVVDLACGEESRIEQGSVLRLGVMSPKPMGLRLSLVHPHAASPFLLLRIFQGDWYRDVPTSPTEFARLLRQGQVQGPPPLVGSLKRTEAGWEIAGEQIRLLEGLSPGRGEYGQYLHPDEIMEGQSLKVWTFSRDGHKYVAGFRVAEKGKTALPGEGQRADDMLSQGETALARRGYRSLIDAGKTTPWRLAKATLGTLQSLVLEGDDRAAQAIWLGQAPDKLFRSGLKYLESGQVTERDFLIFQQIGCYFHSLNPDARAAEKALNSIMKDVYSRSSGLDDGFRRLILSNWYLFLKEVFEGPPPQSVLASWSNCVRDSGLTVRPKAIWFPALSDWSEEPVSPSMAAGAANLAENPVLHQLGKVLAAACCVVLILYFVAPSFRGKTEEQGDWGPTRVTLNGSDSTFDRDDMVALGGKNSKDHPHFYRAEGISAFFEQNGKLRELFGNRLELDGKTVLDTEQDSSQILKRLGEPSKSLGFKKIYFYVFQDGGQRVVLEVDASMESHDGGVTLKLRPGDEAFLDSETVDLIAKLESLSP